MFVTNSHKTDTKLRSRTIFLSCSYTTLIKIKRPRTDHRFQRDLWLNIGAYTIYTHSEACGQALSLCITFILLETKGSENVCIVHSSSSYKSSNKQIKDMRRKKILISKNLGAFKNFKYCHSKSYFKYLRHFLIKYCIPENKIPRKILL